MHNFSKPTTKVKDALADVGKKLQSPKKEFLASNKDTLSDLFETYDELAAKDQLHTLSRKWTYVAGMNDAEKQEVADNRQRAHDLYGDDRPFVNAHWEYLTAKNGGETLYCPI